MVDDSSHPIVWEWACTSSAANTAYYSPFAILPIFHCEISGRRLTSKVFLQYGFMVYGREVGEIICFSGRFAPRSGRDVRFWPYNGEVCILNF